MSIIKPLTDKTILSNTLGNILEWYDFTLYGTLATIIAHVFFPANNPVTSLLLTFGVFAVGFLMRPIGGIIYGHLGDRFGRRKALLSSIVLMTIPTVLLGLLPGYASWGILSSILITLVRLAQGAAVGGEFTGTMSFLVETAPKNHRGVYGSYALVGVLAGILVGIGMVAFFSAIMSKADFASWGWRIPFLLSAVLGLVVWILRHQLKETPAFLTAQKNHRLTHTPLMECFLSDKLAIFKGFVIIIFNSFAFYLLMIYAVTYFSRVLNINLTTASAINLFMVTLTLILVPIAGVLSDRFGRKKIMGLSALLFIFSAYPINVFFIHQPVSLLFFIGQAFVCILLAMYIGPMATTLAELMPTEIRYTAVAIAYNMALTLFGGTAPLISTFIIEKLHLKTAPGILLTLSAIISFIGLLTIKETYRQDLR